jgi:sterol 3beta-glucosyltransferase
MQKHVEPVAIKVASLAYEASQDADLLIHTFAFTSGGHAFARQAGIPDISVQFFPIFAPTRDFPHIAFPQVEAGGFYNLFTHKIGDIAYELGNRTGYRQIKNTMPSYPRNLDWPFRDKHGHPPSTLMFAFSPTVLPPPADWGSHVHVTGYWFDSQVDSPDPALDAFISAGSIPISIGFGSMIHPDARNIQETILEGVKLTSHRAVIITGWAEWSLIESSDQFFFTRQAPHAWLFPHCRLNIHHGGAGTTGAALRAGVPGLIIPFTADQPFWARQLHSIGVGIPPLSSRKLSSTEIANAIKACLQNEDLVKRANRLARQIRDEEGIKNACKIIEMVGPK